MYRYDDKTGTKAGLSGVIESGRRFDAAGRLSGIVQEENRLKEIKTQNAPGAIGPYSQGYEANGIVYTSGQIPADPVSGTIPEGIAAQAEQSCKNVGAILEAAGSGFDGVFKTTCFLADMGDFAAFNEVYAKYFTSKPARSCVAVRTLPKNVLCEIEAMAVKREKM